MIAASVSAINPSEPIRRLDLRRDLYQVADLIELCFPIHADPDGKTYVDEMRKAARDMRLMGWLANISSAEPGKVSGFVWEENNHIIGNLSLIPLRNAGRRVHLIANVAVHPEYRRRGIARKLTQHALAHLQRQQESQVWLQVRDDNPPAVDLYRSLGFKDQASRTTWRIRPIDFRPPGIIEYPGFSVRRRMPGDWQFHKNGLQQVYPETIRWNLPVNFRRFSPGLIQTITNFMDGESYKHWSLSLKGTCQGVITWQKSDSYANNLWLAIRADTEEELLPTGLAHVMKRLSKNHPLSIDYPKGRFQAGFEALGFAHFRTLVWMRCHLGR